MEWKVSSEESGLKLQIFIKNKIGEEISARQIKKAIDSNLCFVNGKPQKFATFVVGRGDIVTLKKNFDSPSESKFKFEKSLILYEDSHLLIYNKPAGISSECKELLKALQAYAPSLELVHRLDKDTTGALIFAKTHAIKELMVTIFRKHHIQKNYLALVDGIPSEKEGIIENYLGKIHAFEGQTIWGEVDKSKGLHAKTLWKIERFGKNASLLKCSPITGRTHQIRVHLSSIGHPILTDFQYGKLFRCKYQAGRTLLHASELFFSHPVTEVDLKIKAPVPIDFLEAMDKMLHI